MLTDTRISCFLIPATVWHEGHPDRSDLPPIARPAQDALDIERRTQKDVRLANEAHRYVLCCERIQGIVKDLSQSGLLHPPTRFMAYRLADEAAPLAIAYVALLNTISRGLQKSFYPRISAVFFTPDDAQTHANIYQAMHQQPTLDGVFSRAAKEGSVGNIFTITPEHCRKAFDTRYELLKDVASHSYGLVDIIELA